MVSRRQESRIEGRWLFLIVAWVLYAIILVAAFVTHQPPKILHDTLYSGGLIMVLVTYAIILG